MGENVRFALPGGGEGSGYLANADGSGKSVVVIQEWWGLNDQIKGVADRFAAAGYTALAPDLYNGRVTGDADEANHLMEGLDWVGATDSELRGAVQHLKASRERCAIMGFCMGGALTILGAVKIPEVDAGVCYYGIPPAEQADPASIAVPLQCHFANEDDWCTPAAVEALESTLRAAGVTHEVYRYEAAHGFFNETADYHDASASARAWERTLGFLEKHL